MRSKQVPNLADVARALACSAETLLGATGREEFRPSRQECLRHESRLLAAAFLLCAFVSAAYAQTPVKITLDQAIDMALKHNHT